MDGSGDSFRSNIPVPPPSIPIRSLPTFGRVPPPIPPRLNEIKVPLHNILAYSNYYIQSLVGDTTPAPAAAEATAEASGGDDLGFLDVQVPSAQEVQAEQTQANKMANIMGAFGGMGAPGPAQAPMVLIIIIFILIYLVEWNGKPELVWHGS